MIRPIVSQPPITIQFMIFKFFQTKSRVEVWLHENNDMRIEGQIIVSKVELIFQGFDEFMNTVLEDAVEVNVKGDTRRKIGKICLKGDNIALICNISSE